MFSRQFAIRTKCIHAIPQFVSHSHFPDRSDRGQRQLSGPRPPRSNKRYCGKPDREYRNSRAVIPPSSLNRVLCPQRDKRVTARYRERTASAYKYESFHDAVTRARPPAGCRETDRGRGRRKHGIIPDTLDRICRLHRSQEATAKIPRLAQEAHLPRRRGPAAFIIRTRQPSELGRCSFDDRSRVMPRRRFAPKKVQSSFVHTYVRTSREGPRRLGSCRTTTT